MRAVPLLSEPQDLQDRHGYAPWKAGVRSLHSPPPVPFRLRSSASRRNQGFTLVELMAVVVIIALMTGLAAPSMMGAMADARAQDLAGRIVNLYNGARARAQRGRAQLVRFTAADNGQQGGFVAYEGNNNSCNASDWAAITGVPCGPSGFCTDQLNPADRQLSGEVLKVGMLTTGAAGSFAETVADMCYESTGTFWRAGAAVGANLLMSSSNAGSGGNLSGGFLIRVQRLAPNGDSLSPDRLVIAPLGAAARIVR
jgi:type II secretion system protein H